MKSVFDIIQIIISVILITLILLQSKGSGLGSTFGQSQELYRTKRGMEKIVYLSTVIIAVLFLIISLLSFMVR